MLINNISVCIITKNESKKLERCLKSLKPFDFEIVVVDTGSTDDTMAVLDELADVKGSFKWCDDFSAARNYAASLSHNDYIISLDSDEWIELIDVKALCDFYENKANSSVGRLEILNQVDLDGEISVSREWIARLYDRRFFGYRGRIHEQIEPLSAGTSADRVNVKISANHDGYLLNNEAFLKKMDRNISLLLDEIQKSGEDAYLYYQLGKSYFLKKDYEKSVEAFEKVWDFDIDVRLSYVQDLMETYGYALLNAGKAEAMMILPEMYDVFGHTADYAFVTGLAYMNNGLFDKAIEMFVRATTYKDCTVSGTNSYKAWYNAGVICECMGKKAEAREFYIKCGEFDKAKEAMGRL